MSHHLTCSHLQLHLTPPHTPSKLLVIPSHPMISAPCLLIAHLSPGAGTSFHQHCSLAGDLYLSSPSTWPASYLSLKMKFDCCLQYTFPSSSSSLWLSSPRGRRGCPRPAPRRLCVEVFSILVSEGVSLNFKEVGNTASFTPGF